MNFFNTIRDQLLTICNQGNIAEQAPLACYAHLLKTEPALTVTDLSSDDAVASRAFSSEGDYQPQRINFSKVRYEQKGWGHFGRIQAYVTNLNDIRFGPIQDATAGWDEIAYLVVADENRRPLCSKPLVSAQSPQNGQFYLIPRESLTIGLSSTPPETAAFLLEYLVHNVYPKRKPIAYAVLFNGQTPLGTSPASVTFSQGNNSDKLVADADLSWKDVEEGADSIVFTDTVDITSPLGGRFVLSLPLPITPLGAMPLGAVDIFVPKEYCSISL